MPSRTQPPNDRTASFGTAPAAGNTIVVIGYDAYDEFPPPTRLAVTDTASNTYQVSNAVVQNNPPFSQSVLDGSNKDCWLGWSLNAASATSVTRIFTDSGGYFGGTVWLLELAGVSAADAGGQTNGQTTNANGDVPSPTLTLNDSSEFVVGVAQNNENVTGVLLGWTSLGIGAVGSGYAGYRNGVSAGSFSATWPGSGTASNFWTTVIMSSSPVTQGASASGALLL